VAAIRSSGASQSTIKLVATNLIANGKLDGKIKILHMQDRRILYIYKPGDACDENQSFWRTFIQKLPHFCFIST
jgi:hypothetical protein